MAERPFTRRQVVALAAGILLCVAVVWVLARAGIPPRAAGAGGLVALMALWWILEPVPLWVTALLPLPFLPLTGVAPVGQVLVQYLDPVIFLFLGGMWIAAAMQQSGLHRRMALGIVGRLGSGPRRIVLGFMMATAFVSLWMSNTAAALMMFPIAQAVLQKFEEQVGRDDPLLRRFGLALMLGLAYAASIAGVGTKIGTGTNFVFIKQAAGLLPREIDFATWLGFGMPIVIIALPLAWLYLVRVAAPLPVQEFPGAGEAIAEARRALGRMTAGEWIGLAAFLTAALLWAFRKDIELGPITVPGWEGFIPWSWSDLIGRPVATLPPPFAELLGPRGAEGATAMLVALALMLIPVQRRPFRMALGWAAARGISWGLLVLLGGGFAMAFGIQRSGLSQVVAGALDGVRPDSPFLSLLVVCLVTTALSEVASNTASASILLPLLAASGPTFGLHPALLMLAATLAASFGFMLPAGTPPNAVAFSSGYIRVGQMARSGLVVDIGGAALVAVICYFLAPWVLGIAR